MKLRRGKMDYKVPLVERIECVCLDDKASGMRWMISLVSHAEMTNIKKQNKIISYGVPNYASYLPLRKNGMLSLFPKPDKGYEAKCRYITTNEF